MNLRTSVEETFEILRQNDKTIWISDFIVFQKIPSSLSISSFHDKFQNMFISTFNGENENDGFNALTTLAGLTFREICIIRAYAKYIVQTRYRFSQQYLEKTLSNHPQIAKALIDLFSLKHNPHNQIIDKNEITILEQNIKQLLENVQSLDEDRSLRRFWILINATLRTNAFQTVNGKHKSYISIKIDSKQVPELPLPHPLFDTFVYSTRFEGIHLRGNKIARGGIRWSDRHEDFRTEVLGLMKAQKVKNAIIVPSGSKGGFVPKFLPVNGTRDEIQAEVIACYKLFISGLLDITDNIIENVIVQPSGVICHDDNDSYLVVAADKGTASFSDIANEISAAYNFWLGDAFASGGSVGYDHKKMGITARGTWESIKRHFRELAIDPMQTPITVIGIGDMSGDVFGNGMIYSKKIRLIAAFDHRHIFIDPNPKEEATYKERLHLFNLPSSSWEDFDTSLISKGGGIYKRNLKVIPISKEAQQALNINATELAPNELIQAILKAPVDLLFNGGIGTYVMSSQENNDIVGDKTNDFCRITANELRCKVVGEGGNLGFTQKARIEFALNGGLINTDFIDNSAGVDCSDHEVNIKILLDKKIANNELTLKERNELLTSMTDDVTKLVLKDNYYQALTMSFSSMHSANYADLYHMHIKKLESLTDLSREVEFLPDDKQLSERQSRGQGLTRPELAVLLAYTKIHVKSEMMKSISIDDTYFTSILASAFPETIGNKFANDLSKHHLKRDIIATQISNLMINKMGMTFPFRLQAETGSSIEKVALAFLVSYNILHSEHLQKHLTQIEDKLPIELTYKLLHIERQLLNMSTRWFLQNERLSQSISKVIAHYEPNIALLEKIIPDLIVGETKASQQALIDQCIKAGLPIEIAQRYAISRVMYTALNIIEVSTLNRFDLVKTASIYFAIGGKFNLVWFRDKLANDSREGLCNNLARLSLRDDLDKLQRKLTTLIIKSDHHEQKIDQLLSRWIINHNDLLARWNELLIAAQETHLNDYTMYFVALRELDNLTNSCSTFNSLSIEDTLNL